MIAIIRKIENFLGACVFAITPSSAEKIPLPHVFKIDSPTIGAYSALIQCGHPFQ